MTTEEAKEKLIALQWSAFSSRTHTSYHGDYLKVVDTEHRRPYNRYYKKMNEWVEINKEEAIDLIISKN